MNATAIPMSIAQPALEALPHAPAFDRARGERPFGAVVARHLSVWPFAARTARLFLLLDRSLPDPGLRRGVLRAMQHAYSASDGYSQTRAVREAALAAHYVLRYHNRDALPLDQVNAASAVAALRGNVAYVALAGHAAAFGWRDAQLTGQRGVLRLPRPLGLEQDPLITHWRTPLEPGDRLVLVCGGKWRQDSEALVNEILSGSDLNSTIEHQLAEVLGDTQPAGVLVIGGPPPARHIPHLRLVSPSEPVAAEESATVPAHRRHIAWWPLLFTVLGFVLLALVGLAGLTIAQPPAAVAEQVDYIRPSTAVRLGASAANVVDLAVGDDAIYTLDVVEGVVRGFALDGLDQQPTADTIIARAGSPLDGGRAALAAPVAIESISGGLAIVDQSRAVVELGADRQLSTRAVPTSSKWQAVGALGADPDGNVLLLDSSARQLLAYPPLSEPVLDPPRLVLDASSAPRLSFDRVVQVLGQRNSTILRLDDGSVQRVDAAGVARPLLAMPSDGRMPVTGGIAADQLGNLYLADVRDGRVLQTTPDGTLLRQLRDPTLAGVRAVALSPDARRLFALVASGVLVFDIPSM